MENSKYGYHKNLRLFNINGLEYLDYDNFSSLHDNDFLFFSFGNIFILNN